MFYKDARAAGFTIRAGTGSSRAARSRRPMASERATLSQPCRDQVAVQERARHRRRRLCRQRAGAAAARRGLQCHGLRHRSTSAADFLPNDTRTCSVIQGDIRDTASSPRRCKGIDAVMHLACISNDASFELDEKLSHDHQLRLLRADGAWRPRRPACKRFVYASSSSVYGVTDAPDVTEEHPLVPLTLYNKYKGMCEPLLFKHQSHDFTCVDHPPGDGLRLQPAHAARPLGQHPDQPRRQQAARSPCSAARRCGRTCISRTWCDALRAAARGAATRRSPARPSTPASRTMSIMDIAQMVQDGGRGGVPGQGRRSTIVTTPTDDIRSYHVNSDKIARVLGFEPKRTIEDAVRDLCTRLQGPASCPTA